MEVIASVVVTCEIIHCLFLLRRGVTTTDPPVTYTRSLHTASDEIKEARDDDNHFVVVTERPPCCDSVNRVGGAYLCNVNRKYG